MANQVRISLCQVNNQSPIITKLGGYKWKTLHNGILLTKKNQRLVCDGAAARLHAV